MSVSEDNNDSPANTWERNIDKHGNDIVISGESDEHSSRAAAHDDNDADIDIEPNECCF